MISNSDHHPTGGNEPDLAKAVSLVLASGLPEQPKAPRSAIDTVIGARLRPAGTSGHVSAAYTAALTWSLLHTGQAAAAVDLADRHTMAALQRVAGKTPPSTQSTCYAVLAEVYLLNGRLHEAANCARICLDYAAEAHDDGCTFRGKGLLSVTLAIAGEVRTARDLIADATALCGDRGWLDEQSAWPVLLADAMVTGRRGDAARSAMLAANLASHAGDDVVCRAAARYANVILQAVRQDNRQIVATARRLATGPDSRLCPPFLVDMAISGESLAHVHLGDPAAALNCVEGRVSPPDHAVCFELNRATAYLQLGELRKALHVTEACVRATPDHSLATLASVQLRRALAYEGMGMHDLADAEYSKASHLAYELGMVSAALGLPFPVMQRLYLRLVAKEPEFGTLLDAHYPRNIEYPTRPELDFTPPQLTTRETVLATWLMTDLSLPAIAAELQVSLNTVKSQVRSLYAKLDASSRDEAVLKLERTGLYSRPDLPRRSGVNSATRRG